MLIDQVDYRPWTIVHNRHAKEHERNKCFLAIDAGNHAVHYKVLNIIIIEIVANYMKSE